MANTLTDIIRNSLLSLGVIGFRESVSADYAVFALEKLQSLLLALPGQRDWIAVEVTDDYTTKGNERITVVGDVDVTITLPQLFTADRYDLMSLSGVTVATTGGYTAAPRDGTRVQIVTQEGTDYLTYIYRSDRGKWMTLSPLAAASDVPINQDLHAGLEALLAVEIAPAFGVEPTKLLFEKARDAARQMRARFMRVPDAKIDNGLTRNWDTMGTWQ